MGCPAALPFRLRLSWFIQTDCALCRMVHSTDIVELELKSKKFSLSVKKKEALEQPEPVYAQVRGLAPLSFCERLAQSVSGLVTILRLGCLPASPH